MRKILPLLLSFLMLTGCAALTGNGNELPNETASPPEQENEELTVAVHWDSWTPETERNTQQIVRRWYDEYTDELIPSGDYGELIPYIGAESHVMWWGDGYLYGLATMDGVIVTDAVFLKADLRYFYDASEIGEKKLPVFLLSRAEELSDGTAREEYALAASDGSWCTGMKYRTHIYDTHYGSLMTEKEGDVVLVGADGTDVFRWDGDSLPIEGFRTDNAWYDEYMLLLGDYLQYEISWTEEGPQYAYIHLPTGFVYHEPPDDVPPFADWDDSEISFNGGTYRYSVEWITIETDSGEIYKVAPEGYSVYAIVDGKILLGQHLEDNTYRCMVKDFHGNTVMEPYDEHELYKVSQYRKGPLMLHWSDFEGMGGVMDAEGNLLAEPCGFTLKQYGDRLIFADEEAYRVMDTEGNDILRLLRYNWDD